MLEFSTTWLPGVIEDLIPTLDFPLFDDSTKFISVDVISFLGLCISALIFFPLLYRLFELQKVERGKVTVFGQFAAIAAALVPLLYLSALIFYWKVDPKANDIFTTLIGFAVAFLHYFQDGRVLVCCPELLSFWLGKIVVHTTWTIHSLLKYGLAIDSLIAVSIALLSVTIPILELKNFQRHPDDVMDQKSLFSLLTSNFADRIVEAGLKGPVNSDEFTLPPKSLNAYDCYEKFDSSLHKCGTSKNRIVWATVMSLRTNIIATFALGAVKEISYLAEPRLISYFLNSLAEFKAGNSPIYHSYYYALTCGLLPMFGACFENLEMLVSDVSQASIRVSLFSTIYRKGLRLSPAAKERHTTSKIMNLVSTDSDYLFSFVEELPFLFTVPPVVLFAWWQLWLFLGPTFLAAVVVYLLVIPLSGYLSRGMSPIFFKKFAAFDSRVELTSNVFKNIKSLKLHAWETPFFQKILNIRANEELHYLQNAMYYISVLDEAWIAVGPLVTMAVFTAFLYFGQGILTAEIIFPSLILLDVATEPFMRLPFTIQTFAHVATTQKRLLEFLDEEEHESSNYIHLDEGIEIGSNSPNVVVQDAHIAWMNTDETTVLKDISFTATRGDLVCITGLVGTGKTALLKALGGEMSLLSGEISLKGSLAYCSQTVWLENLTLRENVLFGQKFEEEWYNLVIDKCELRSDLRILPQGDETDLGEKGVILSGGQQARVALARAVYSRADIYLFDDVLSAVDEIVGGRLIENLFSSNGLLADRTIILATHNIKVLSHSSQILVLENNRIVDHTSLAQICNEGRESKTFQMIKDFGDAQILEANSLNAPRPVGDKVLAVEGGKYSCPLPLVPANLLLSSDMDEEREGEEEEEGYLASGSKKSASGIGLKVYKRYFDFLGLRYFTFLFFLILTSVLLSNFMVVYMGWIANKGLNSFEEGHRYLLWYFIFIICGSSLSLMANISFYSGIAIKISIIVHEKMLWNVMRAPMAFFDVTPLGRLVNRFTHDLRHVDEDVPWIVILCLHTFLQLFVTLVMILIGIPAAALMIVPLAWIADKKIRKAYTPTKRKVTRICSAANSPILSHIEDSMSGQSTIRIFGRSEHFIRIYEQRSNYWVKADMFDHTLNRWLAFRMEIFTMVITLTAALSVTRLVSVGAISVGFAGVINNFAMKTGNMIADGIRYLVRAETNGVSLKRLYEYIDVAQEAPYYTTDMDMSITEWPRRGAVRFEKLTARYSDKGPDILKGISLDIQPAEKVGVVGRTGSGKSTLSLSVFRIIEPFGGRIIIDDIDISTLGLYDLRRKLSIIPQDAQLLAGTVRENLDPLKSVDDTKLWEVLGYCQLRTFFESKEEGLDFELNDSTGALSRGQNQLLCLGRALVHESSVLILDEATASVDVETDHKVQEIIREHFKNRTVITIAHRLKTIMDSDKILVLDNGEILEFGTPQELIAQKGQFYKMYGDGHYTE